MCLFLNFFYLNKTTNLIYNLIEKKVVRFFNFFFQRRLRIAFFSSFSDFLLLLMLLCLSKIQKPYNYKHTNGANN